MEPVKAKFAFERIAFVSPREGGKRGGRVEAEAPRQPQTRLPARNGVTPAAAPLTAPPADTNTNDGDDAPMPLDWRSPRSVGAGLHNVGNTCFMNAVLQALAHTPALAETLLATAPAASPACPVHQELRAHVQRAFRTAGAGACTFRSPAPFAPMRMAQALRHLNTSFQLGEQEDAHEFLLSLLDNLEEAEAKEGGRDAPKPMREAVQAIFRGTIKSSVSCVNVPYTSSRDESFLDISLQVHRARSLQSALHQFFSTDVLDGENRFRCPTTGTLERAVRTSRLAEPPHVLVLHLKRFEAVAAAGAFGAASKKIGRHVRFPAHLDMAPYLAPEAAGKKATYLLNAVVVHRGSEMDYGHYVAYVRAATGAWHLCDDSAVATVSLSAVLKQQAYILVYTRSNRPAPTPSGPVAAARAVVADLAAAAMRACSPGRKATAPVAGGEAAAAGGSGTAAEAAAAPGVGHESAVTPAGQPGGAAAALQWAARLCAEGGEGVAAAAPTEQPGRLCPSGSDTKAGESVSRLDRFAGGTARHGLEALPTDAGRLGTHLQGGDMAVSHGRRVSGDAGDAVGADAVVGGLQCVGVLDRPSLSEAPGLCFAAGHDLHVAEGTSGRAVRDVDVAGCLAMGTAVSHGAGRLEDGVVAGAHTGAAVDMAGPLGMVDSPVAAAAAPFDGASGSDLSNAASDEGLQNRAESLAWDTQGGELGEEWLQGRKRERAALPLRNMSLPAAMAMRLANVGRSTKKVRLMKQFLQGSAR